MISSFIFSAEKIGLIYRGDYSGFSGIYYEIYKYFDIIPPDLENKIIEVNYNGSYTINYMGYTYYASENNISEKIKEIFQNVNSRSILVIPEGFSVVTDYGTNTSKFMTFESTLSVKLSDGGITYNYDFTPSLGESIIRIPYNTIKLFIDGEGSVKINGISLSIPATITVPPSVINISDGINSKDYDLRKYSEKEYIINPDRVKEIKTLKTEIYGVFELESGTFFRGSPLSVWISKKDGNIRIADSYFMSDYGDADELISRLALNGVPVYAYEKNRTIYVITSSGELFTIGEKNIKKDFGRMILGVTVSESSMLISTFKLEIYRLNFDTGLYKEGNLSSVNYTIPDISPENKYYINKYYVEINSDKKIFSVYERTFSDEN
ncbi:MAG: hypothetical protein H7A31_02580 [Thermotogae bacterium]|nr:hypothetical protein [Thermotogota bacterium]